MHVVCILVTAVQLGKRLVNVRAVQPSCHCVREKIINISLCGAAQVLNKQLTMLRYMTRKDNSSVPNPRGSLSASVPQRAIVAANRQVDGAHSRSQNTWSENEVRYVFAKNSRSQYFDDFVK